MKFRLSPSTDEVFDLFQRAAQNMDESAKALERLVSDFTDLEAKHAEAKDHERKGDEFIRALMHNLDRSFVTPFDREDIHALAEDIDNVVDSIYHLSEMLVLIPLDSILPELSEQVAVMVRMTAASVELVSRLKSMKKMRPLLDEIDELESEGDAIFRRAVVRLFSGQLEALEVLKWKDIIEAAESTLDIIEDVSDTVASILVKHA